MAQTKDGLPLFTFIVRLLLDSIGEHGFYFAAFTTYFVFGVCAVLLHLKLSCSFRFPRWSLIIFTALACVTAVTPFLRTIAFDGLAGQRILAGYFQPSDFGVLLIVSILCFSAGRLMLATASVIIASAMHPGYLVPSATLLLIYAGFEISAGEKTGAYDWWIKLATLALGIAALLAMAFMIRSMFPPSSVEAYREAHRLLTEFRIPHHADPWAWNDYRILYKTIICGVAIAVLPRGRLRFVVAAASLATLVFVMVGLIPNLNAYKLVTPWRISIALVPVAALACLSIAATKVTAFLSLDANAWRPVCLISTAITASCIIAGTIRAAGSLSKPIPVYRDFVRSHLAAGQQYLTPPSYKDFRLLTGAPQYITHKSHPYHDLEVLEWYRRLREARTFFQTPTFDCQSLQRFAIMEGVTHLITTRDHINSTCRFARPVFEESGIVVLHLDKTGLD